MKIENSFSNYSINSYNKKCIKEQSGKNLNINDTLEISDVAIKLESHNQDIRYEKVYKVAERINAGQYSVSSSDIADKILSNIKNNI